MMSINRYVIAIATLGALLLSACNAGNQTNTVASSPAATPTAESQPVATPTPDPKTEPATSTTTSSHGGQGGQVIESGPYHLELLTLNETDGIHIDFFLQKGDDHAAIPDAQVTAQVQLPNGSQKNLELKYDAAGKHYYAVLPSTTIGTYQVAILSDIQGEKVNARYRFQR